MTDLAQPIVRSPKRAEAWARKAFRKAATSGGIIPLPTWAEPDWYVNASTGLASNTGTSPSSPLPSVEAVVQRWGTASPILQQNTVIHVQATEAIGFENAALQPLMVGGTNFGIIGVPLLVAGPFALGAVTAKNRATAQLLEAAGFTAAGITTQMLVVNQTRGNSRAVIWKLAAGTATLTQPLAPLTFADASSFPSSGPAEVDTWATGDMVSVYSVPALNLKELRVYGGDSTPSFSGGAAWVQYIRVIDASGVPSSSVFEIAGTDNVPWYVDCVFDPYLSTSPDEYNGVDSKFIIGCALNGGLALQGGAMIGGYATGFGVGLANYGCLDGDAIISGDLVAPGSGTLGVGVSISFIGMAYFDNPAAGNAQVFNGGTVKADAIFYPTTFLWGPSGFNVGDNSHLQKVTSQTWTQVLLVTGALTLNGAGTGSTFNAAAPNNPYTAGVTITPAHLDANQAILNPQTGASYFHE